MRARRLLAALLVTVVVAAGCGGDDDDAPEAATEATPMEQRSDDGEAGDSDEDSAADAGTEVAIEGLVVTEDLSFGHERGELEYESLTPVGGDHNPFWQKCGHYTVEIPAERAVHSMEHGAVWIAYRPGTDVAVLEPIVAADEWLLMSPVEGLETAVVLSAWGAQVSVDDADDPRVTAFIATFIRQGPENAPCVRGGVGEPPTDPGPGLDV